MEFSFEDKIDYIEMVMGLKLLDWQKKALKQIDEGVDGMIWIPGKASGRTVYMKAVKILRLLNSALPNSEEITNYETR